MRVNNYDVWVVDWCQVFYSSAQLIDTFYCVKRKGVDFIVLHEIFTRKGIGFLSGILS
jgi:hypothetical protein